MYVVTIVCQVIPNGKLRCVSNYMYIRRFVCTVCVCVVSVLFVCVDQLCPLALCCVHSSMCACIHPQGS